MKKTSLIIIILTLVYSCNKEVTINFIEQQIETSQSAEISIVYPKAEGTEDIANRINSSIQNYIVKQINFSEDSQTKGSIDDAVAKFNYEFSSFKNEFPNDAQQWEAFIDGEVTYRSPEIISIAINSYLDTGGAHGNTTVHFFNFDPQTGKLLTKKELISNTEKLSKLIEHKLIDEVKSKSGNEPVEDLFFGKDFQLPESLGYSDEGLIILYNPYEIASYAQGIIEFTIPFEEVNSFLNRS
ncbi:DUF3298 and DUF4163 domain-containing protein [uncultured Psychroserpens sp.]|uniref:DUF3298 and DUF4163 domain-containing protein n=1 Tax=uncultured Psychroserpens sp. TaxID=255436 RepID=UPI002621A183|nr:DUF3298 and DUF4163 domain-containing protein [uncultured Psychroserpens sp.]